MSEKTKKKGKLKWIILIVVLILIGIYGMDDSGQMNDEQFYTDAENAEPSKEPILKNEDAKAFQYNANDYIGRKVELVGQVFDVTNLENNKIIFQMFNDIENSKNNIYVSYIGEAPQRVSVGHIISLVGIVQGEVSGENAFGKKVSATKVITKEIYHSIFDQ